MHECKHESKFDSMAKTIDKMDREIFGNGGKTGLTYSVPQLNNEVKHLKTAANKLTTAVEGLVKFKDEYAGAEKKSTKNLKMAGVVLSLIAVLATVFFGFRDMSKKVEQISETVEATMDIIYVPKTRSGTLDTLKFK